MVMLDHAIEDMDIFDHLVAVAGRGGVFLFRMKFDAKGKVPKRFLSADANAEFSTELFEPAYADLEKRGGDPAKYGLVRSVAFFNGGTCIMIGCLDSKIMYALCLYCSSRADATEGSPGS
jgi:hypothetical protein